MAICCARKSLRLPRDAQSPSATRVAEEMHFIPPRSNFGSFLLVSSSLSSFPNSPFFVLSLLSCLFQPTIAARATDNAISICIYVPTVPSTGLCMYSYIYQIPFRQLISLLDSR